MVSEQLKHIWGDYLAPMFKRPEKIQFAALCYKGDGPSRRVLLITSRDTGRWVIPKGWPMRGKSSLGTAAQEAWEEAGVYALKTDPTPVGSFTYDKRLKGDWAIPVRTLVYAVRVRSLSDTYPESCERTRKWVTPAEAATMVQEPELQEILADFPQYDSFATEQD